MFELKLKISCLGFSILILGGCIDLPPYLHDRRISQEDMMTVKMSPEIQAIHFAPKKHIVFYYPFKHLNPYKYRCECHFTNMHCCMDSYLFDLDDPVSLVQHHFIKRVSTEFELDNILSISDAQPRSEDQHDALQQSFGNGLILTFDTRIWNLEMHTIFGPGYIPDPSASSGMYSFDYGVRGTLIRLEDSKILWRGTCRAGATFKMDTGPLPSRLEMDVNSPPLKTARALTAERCSEALVRNFRGKRVVASDKLGK